MAKNIIDLMARILIAGMFVYEAIDSVMFFQDTKIKMAAYGITWQQDFLLITVIVLLFFGALLILLGYRMGLGGLMLLLYWIPVTFIAHSFWAVPEFEVRIEALIFSKNLAVAGGVMLLMIKGSGKYSIRRLMPVTRIPKGET